MNIEDAANQEMTPTDALSLFRQVADKWVGAKADHVVLDRAIELLKPLVEADAASTSKASVSDKDLGIENDNPPADQ